MSEDVVDIHQDLETVDEDRCSLKTALTAIPLCGDKFGFLTASQLKLQTRASNVGAAFPLCFSPHASVHVFIS